MSDLKPCPFCGSEASIIQFRSPASYYVSCACGCVSTDNHKDSAVAVEVWNRRTQPEATAPAQDLSAAIQIDIEQARKEGRVTFSGVLPRQHTFGPVNFPDPIQGLREVLKQAEEVIEILWVSNHANRADAALESIRTALASSANALSAGDRVDAERYRFLRDHLEWNVGLVGEIAEWDVTLTSPYGITEDEDNLDAAVDAAHSILQSQKDGPCES